MNFTKKTSILIIIVGALSIMLGLLVDYSSNGDSFQSYISGFGCTLIGCGVVTLIYARMNPNYLKQVEISTNDERLIKIREKAAYTCFYITMFALVIVQLVLLFLDFGLPSLMVTMLMFVHIFCFLFLAYRYDKKM